MGRQTSREKGPMWSHRLTTDQHTQQKKLHETSERTTWSAVVPLMVKNWPAKAGDTETRIPSLGRDGPLEEVWQPTLVFLSENPVDRGA